MSSHFTHSVPHITSCYISLPTSYHLSFLNCIFKNSSKCMFLHVSLCKYFCVVSETRKGCEEPKRWNYQWLWVLPPCPIQHESLKSNSGPVKEQKVLLTCNIPLSSLCPPFITQWVQFALPIYLCVCPIPWAWMHICAYIHEYVFVCMCVYI